MVEAENIRQEESLEAAVKALGDPICRSQDSAEWKVFFSFFDCQGFL